jgi:transposase-like protein
MDVYLIGCANGVSRKTRTGTMSERRVWKCRSCRRQFSVLTGTIMHGTKIPVRVWALVIFEMTASKNGTAAREIERKYGVCPRSAWFMLHRIREAMRSDGLLAPMAGTIVADETFVGGDPKNRHAWKRDPDRQTPERVLPGSMPNRHTDKTPVLSLINAETGEVRSQVVANVTGRTLSKVLANNVAMYNSTLHTDSAHAYVQIGHLFASHKTVNHAQGEYVRDGVSTNRAEGFFSQLKRSLDGTHHHVSEAHLPRYLAEFDFRYSTCKASDFDRMVKLVGQSDRRLTYKAVTAP